MIRNKLQAAFLSAFMLTMPALVQAKDATVKRIEFEKTSSNDYMKWQAIGEKGVIFATEEDDKQKTAPKGYDVWTITKLDTMLNEAASTDINIGSHSIINWLEADGNFYAVNTNFFAVGMSKRKESTKRYVISIYDSNDLTLKNKFEGKVEKYMPNWQEPIVLGDNLYMIGEGYSGSGFSYDKKLIALITNIKSGETNLVELDNLSPKFTILSCDIDKACNEVQVLVKEIYKTGNITKLLTFSDGKKTGEITLNLNGDNKYPASAFVTKTKDGNYLISGTYKLDEDGSNSWAAGIFVIKADSNGKTLFSTFTNFLDLKNFTSYLSDRKQEKIEEKKAKAEAKGKEFTKECQILPYRVIEDNDKYILAGEAYKDVYKNKTDKNGISYQVPDGYIYTHYFIVEYDKDGKIEWSNAAELHVKKSYSVKKHLSLNKNTNALQIIYPSYKCIYNTSYDANGEEISSEEIEYVKDEEYLKAVYENETWHWYGNTFLSTDRMKIKDDKGKRKVFSVGKISF